MKTAPLRTCFSTVDKEDKLTDPWRHVIVWKVCKIMWEILDEFGESVLDTTRESGEKDLLDQWEILFHSPTMHDYKEVVYLIGSKG